MVGILIQYIRIEIILVFTSTSITIVIIDQITEVIIIIQIIIEILDSTLTKDNIQIEVFLIETKDLPTEMNSLLVEIQPVGIQQLTDLN